MFIILVILALIIFIDFFSKDDELKCGKYYNNEKTSYVQINSDGTFDFVGHIAMGTVIFGKYNIEDDILILTSNVGEFRFCIKNKNLLFEKANYITDNLIEIGTKYILE